MAHTFGTSVRIPSTSTSTDNPVSGSYTSPSGATVLCVMLKYAGSTARAGGSPTYNSVALTQADSQRYGSTGPEASCEIWYLLAPPIGAYTVSVPNTDGLAMWVVAATGKAGTGYGSALDTSNGAGAVGTNPTASVTTAGDGDIIFGVVANGSQKWEPTAWTGTQLYDTDDGAHGGGAQYYLQTTHGAFAVTWTYGTSEDYGVCVAAFKEYLPSVSVTPGISACIAQTTAPTALYGATSATPGTAAAVAKTTAPTALLGNITATPGASACIASVTAPSVEIGAGGISVTPGVSAAVASTANPTPVLGSISKIPGASSCVATTTAPSISFGSLSVTPAAAAVIAAIIAPAILLGSVTVTPAIASAITRVTNPSVIEGGGEEEAAGNKLRRMLLNVLRI